MKMSGVITITTDFGHQGPFVGVMKGVMLSRLPQARIIDLTHEIVVHWPAEAGFWLARSFALFPAGHGARRGSRSWRGHVARDHRSHGANGHVFLAPDNGLLAPVVGRNPGAGVVKLTASRGSRTSACASPSATFHGRDIFAPIAAELAAGRCVIADLGERQTSLVPAWVDEPTVETGGVSGVVITIDHFGNLITNIDAELVAGIPSPKVHAGNHTFDLLRTYGDTQPGQYLALVNSFGVIEIARAEQSAADGLGLGRGAPVVDQGRDGGARRQRGAAINP